MSAVSRTNDDETCKGNKRQRRSYIFMVEGKQVCRRTFLLYHNIGKHSLESLMKHINTLGVTVRVHGNAGKLPKHAIMYDDVLRVVRFIKNCADERGLPQPAAPRGIDNIPCVYLPCAFTKQEMHQEYKRSLTDERVLALTSFKDIWRTCLPHIRIGKPREDVCGTCEKHRRSIVSAVAEEEKLYCLKAMEEHVNLAKREREFYTECVKKSVQTGDIEERFFHLTFDFSQNVSLPHYARQPGSLYFLSLRKIQIFGVRIDSIQRQLNFLIDENQTPGPDGKNTHGPDAVISMLDWALHNNAPYVSSLSIHADNCPGQNKNRYLLGYFIWRTMTGQNSKIEYHMQVPGHARCLVDSSFAHLKIMYRENDCETVKELADNVERSSKVNPAVLYPRWDWRGWKSFLGQHFKALPGIRQYQHFSFTSEKAGIVILRTTPDDDPKEFSLLKNPKQTFRNAEKPPVFQPGGLTRLRKQYLERSVQPFVSTKNQLHFQC